MGFPMAFLLGFPAGFPGSSLMAFLMTPTYCSPLPTHVSCYEQPSRILQGQLIAAAPCPMHACMHVKFAAQILFCACLFSVVALLAWVVRQWSQCLLLTCKGLMTAGWQMQGIETCGHCLQMPKQMYTHGCGGGTFSNFLFAKPSKYMVPFKVRPK